MQLSDNPFDDENFCLFFSPEKEGVRVKTRPEKGEIVVTLIEDQQVMSVVFEPQTYGDYVSFGALEWLYKKHGELTAALTAQKNALADLAQQNASLKEEVARLKQAQFGTSSEQTKQTLPEIDATPEQGAVVVPIKRKQPKELTTDSKQGRKPLPANLPREERVHDIPPANRFCKCCSGTLHHLGDEITEQLTVIPAQFKVVRHIRKKYVCRHCETFAPLPGPRFLIANSSYASPEFLSYVACNRFQLSLPYYRQESMFEQAGLPFNRTTLSNLMIGFSDRMASLYQVLREELLQQGIVHADETHVQVLKEKGKTPQSQSWLWLYRSGAEEKNQIVLFDYKPDRSGGNPRQFLGVGQEDAFRGYLQVDGYSGYNKLDGITRLGCMAHVRRKFQNVVKTLPSHVTASHAHHAVELIGRLYGIERRIKGLPKRIRERVRKKASLPILWEFKTWLDGMRPIVTASGGLGKAIAYAMEQWPTLIRYVDDGRLSIDNNIAEREVKAVVIGRKNWLFADSQEGMHANAVMYSLVQTAKANGIDPFAYLRYVAETMPTLSTANEVRCLLPWNMPKATETTELLAA